MNKTRLSAVIVEANALRYTPAGLPALDLKLQHESRQSEASLDRSVKLTIKAVAIGSVAERLNSQILGSHWLFSGFLSNPGKGDKVILHIQEFQQI